MNQKTVAVVIPAFNEAATIASVVAQALSVGDVIVVDDGSTDDTANLAKNSGAKVLALGGNTGYEGALGAGVDHALQGGYEFVLTMDADGQHSIESVRALINNLGSADIVVGLRIQKQRMSEWIAGFFGSLLWGIPDPFSGLKLYRASTCRSLMPFDTRRLVGAEMLVQAHRSGLKVIGVSIVTVKRADAPRFDTALRANIRLLRAMIYLMAIHFKVC